MLREKWNRDWRVTRAGETLMTAPSEGTEEYIMLPHDAMIYEKRTVKTKNRHQTGFYPGGSYIYRKSFDAPEDWKGKNVWIEFEGVYMNAKVYINGDYAGGHPYGYTEFSVCADDFLKYGEPNEIKVIVNNSAEENSRWYSGSGIYRNVNLLVGNELHICQNGVRINTREVGEKIAVVEVDTRLENMGPTRTKLFLETELYDRQEQLVTSERTPITIFGRSKASAKQRITVEHPRLWDCEHPELYFCLVRLSVEGLTVDEAREQFGIRTLSLNPVDGLSVNGVPVKLRGACVHHDNGIIGACTLERAEERRCQKLKEAGFNCIRSAHNPVSRAMLDACDREGMLVLDEFSDVWTRQKNNNDYAQYFPDYWEKDVQQMIEKDYNHPSVIMYLAGNEIQEAGTAKGAEQSRKIVERIRLLDNTRYTGNAINALLACMDRMEEIIGAAKQESEEASRHAAAMVSGQGVSDAGSDAVNSMASTMIGPLADAIARNAITTEMIEEFAATTDVTGYNYLTGRHELEKELNPNRVVLGTETFPSDIVRLWQIVSENPHVIGDMTWTGWDYLGEAGVGIFYYDGRQGFMENWPCSIAYTGDIDIIGYRRPISYLREIVYGLREKPYIAVERLNRHGQKPNTTAWMWKDELESWTWHGYEGKPAVVHVYSIAEEVELFLNGRSMGRKRTGAGHGYMASYQLLYEPGELRAVNYQDGIEGSSWKLNTAKEEVALDIQADKFILCADGADLAYLMVGFRDDDGVQNLQVKKEVRISVEGAGTLQGFGSADPETENFYQSTVWDTYDGYVLAVIRAGLEPGEIHVTLEAEGCRSETIKLLVENNTKI